MRIEVRLIEARIRAPVVSSQQALSVRPLLLVALKGSDGVSGFGEAAPLEGYDGVRVQDVRAALEDCRGVLADSDGCERGPLLGECWGAAVLPQAVAAIDLALWDLAGRRAGQPVWTLLGAPSVAAIEVNATIAAPDRAGAAAATAAARASGFGCVKVKVGLGDDPGRLAAVRAAAGPGMRIRLDANGAWSVPEAAAVLRVLEPVGLELCEEPVSGLAAIEELTELTAVPLAIDETAAAPGALDRRACEAVCLKIARCGGISGLLDSARRARATGYDVYLASTFDGPLGIAAAVHAAAAVAPDRPSGLATLGIFERATGALAATGGRIALPTGSGLGDDLLDWYAAA